MKKTDLLQLLDLEIERLKQKNYSDLLRFTEAAETKQSGEGDLF
jgi:FtsZ-binding cell division protein ZapB